MGTGQQKTEGVPPSQLAANYSFEMTGKDIPALHEAKTMIAPRTKINVTFLGNEDLDMRVAASHEVVKLGFTPVPHISARRLESVGHFEEFLGRLQEVGATEHVFSVGGDPATPAGPYPDSLALIESGLFTEYGAKEVSIAGYPEGHPDISDGQLWSFLENKVAALKDQGLGCVILTQFGFDAEAMLRWVEEVRERSIDAEIRIGTPGPASIKRLLAFATRFGIGANAMIVKKYGFSLANLLGSAGPEKFIATLNSALSDTSKYGDVQLHFYAFGGLAQTAQWAQKYFAA